MTIYNTFQDPMFKDNTDLTDLREAEAKAIANPAKKIKLQSGYYFYLPIGGSAVFTIVKITNDFPGYIGMWEVMSAEPCTEGDYDFTWTLKEALEQVDVSAGEEVSAPECADGMSYEFYRTKRGNNYDGDGIHYGYGKKHPASPLPLDFAGWLTFKEYKERAR